MTIDAGQFLRTIQSATPDPPTIHRLAVIKAVIGSRATVLFDGEATTSTLAWPVLGSYSPTVNDRVVIALISGSGVIMGKVV